MQLRIFYATINTENWKKLLWRIMLLILLVSVFPVILMCAIVACLYKLMCFVLIRWQDKTFVKFLDSFDAYWSLENNKTKGVINILGIIESEDPQNLVDFIQEKLRSKLNIKGATKMFYRSMEKYGFYYWQKSNNIDMREYVQLVDSPTKGDYLNTNDLEKMLTNISDQLLPFKGNGMLQILISKQRIMYGENKTNRHAVICRIHHSIGDGVSLIQFLCQILADDMDDSFLKISQNYKKYEIKLSCGFIEMIKKLSEILLCSANAILKIPDNNSLHGPNLIGGTLFKWIGEDENLLIMVKEIKDSVPGVNFTDVLLAALSQSLCNHFIKTMDHIPKHVTTILPVRRSIKSNLELENNFSISILDLPTNERVEAIAECNRKLRDSADSLANSCLVKLCSFLPNYFLRSLMDSRHASLVFSNMAGPKEITISGRNKLKSLVFFAPHRGTTGLDITALSYGRVLRLAASVDSRLISEPNDLELILKDMVAGIKRLHAQYVKK